MKHDGRGNCHCKRCNNLRHHRLVAEFKAAVSRRFGRRAYVDDVVQYHGKTVRKVNGQDTIGPWVDAGMSKGTLDVFVCLEGRVFWFDAKTGGGSLTPEQLAFQSWIRAAGGTAESLRSVEQGIAVLERALTNG
jgi:hypothetical protein